MRVRKVSHLPPLLELLDRLLRLPIRCFSVTHAQRAVKEPRAGAGTWRICSVSESSLRVRDDDRCEKRGERGTVSRPGVKSREPLPLRPSVRLALSCDDSDSAGRLPRRAVESLGLTGTVSLLHACLLLGRASERAALRASDALLAVLSVGRETLEKPVRLEDDEALDCEAAEPMLVRPVLALALRGVA
jgi:hypothetical protein